jgi:hypothetical protein
MLLSMSNHYQTRAARRQNGAGWTLTLNLAFAHEHIDTKDLPQLAADMLQCLLPQSV